MEIWESFTIFLFLHKPVQARLVMFILSVFSWSFRRWGIEKGIECQSRWSENVSYEQMASHLWLDLLLKFNSILSSQWVYRWHHNLWPDLQASQLDCMSMGGLVWCRVPKRSSTVFLVSQYTSYGILKIMLNTWNQALFLLLYYDILMPKFILLFCFWGKSCLTGDWIFYFTWSQLNGLGSYKWLCHIKLHRLECTHMEMISMFC